MAADKNQLDPKGHLFTIEVLVEATTNGLALEKLLHLLNTEVIKDYKVKTGMELGKLIDLNINESLKQALPQRKDVDIKKETEVKKESALKKEPENKPKKVLGFEADSLKIIEQLESFKQSNVLVRLTILKGKGIKLNIPCRILNYDSETQNVNVYHVDEKKVYLFKLNEIDDFVAG
jgi:hypothetical protein